MASSNSIENRFPWSFAGFLLGTISLGIAIWFFYLSKQESVTNLKFLVEDEFPLVELREQFPNIRILYDDEDILKAGKVIKIVRIRLENSGQPILQTYFDQQLPFGLEFPHSAILAVTPISATASYLETSLFREGTKEEFEAGRVLLNKPIIEKGSQSIFKVYLLQEKGLNVTAIKAIGKISGTDEIQVVRLSTDDKTPRGSGRTTGEVIGIGFASGYVGLLALALTVLPVSLYVEHRKTLARKKCCAQFLSENEGLTAEQREIVASYAEGWREYYLPTIRTLAKGGEALDISDLVAEHIGRGRDLSRFTPGSSGRLLRILPLRWEPAVFTISDGQISLNTTNKEVLLKFLGRCGVLN